MNYSQKQKQCSVCKYLEDKAKKERVIGYERLVDGNLVKGTKNWGYLEDSTSTADGDSAMKLTLTEFFQAMGEVLGPVYKSKEENTDF